MSALHDSRVLCCGELPHAMHDVTEGGLATALGELALASGVGLEIQRELIPVLPACARFCRVLGLDPLGLIGSGSLIVAVPAAAASEKLQALRQSGLDAADIGVVTEAPDLLLIDADGASNALPVFARDEFARFLEQREGGQSVG
jgi:hydrogenase expression/formation protein HypE